MIHLNKRNLPRAALYGIFLYILILSSLSLIWCKNHFGNINMEKIVLTLNMPLKGTPTNYLLSFFLEAVLASLVGYIAFMTIRRIILKQFHTFDIFLKFKIFKLQGRFRINPLIDRPILPIVWLCLLLYVVDSQYQLFDYVKSCIQTSDFIENEYINAKEINIDFPEEKKNLICIFMESAETTFQDIENGGVFDENIIPEMTDIAKNNISFSHSDLLEGATVAPGTGWTIAGLTAQTSGCPIKIYTNLGKHEFFLPGVVSIGEILEQEGYHNFFMAGSDFSFAGRNEYFTQHGNYEIWDYFSAIEEGKIPEDYYAYWGFEDQKLYEYAKEKILDLAKEDQPFNFSMITVDTHGNAQEGEAICELCPDKYERQYLNVWACASRQLADFLDWLKAQEFYDDTVIYIAGDHASMERNDFLEDYTYDKYNGSTVRKVYNVFINSMTEPVNTKNRQFTTLDCCPSILAAMGADIEGNRIGLGTNLFSAEPTLAEKYGYDKMFEELGKKSSFYNKELLYP